MVAAMGKLAKKNWSFSKKFGYVIHKTMSSEPIFCIQKHDASQLHYDFRLEIGNALKSWSVPKGPSTDPNQKRLAIETEEHKMSYADFEGIIEKGYGAGTVLLWDKGHFRNQKEDRSLKEQYEDGKIEIFLEGEKIKGGYALVKIKSKKTQWLLIKTKDKAADARRNPVSTETKSVKSEKTLEEIADEQKGN